MLPPLDDTITAQASAHGEAFRGIVRLSGDDSVRLLGQWFRTSHANNGTPDNGSSACRFEGGSRPSIVSGELLIWGESLAIPCDLYYWPPGRGFTGQQAIELHLPGSQPILDATLQTLCGSGCRLAAPGEFTLRAFLSGRIDLTEAEAVLGVIDADDSKQLDIALRQLAGGVGRPLAALRERLLEMLCRLEAEFDFAGEEIEFLDRSVLKNELLAACELVEKTKRQMAERASTAELPRVVLAGHPNTGKSTLFNALIRYGSSWNGSSISGSQETIDRHHLYSLYSRRLEIPEADCGSPVTQGVCASPKATAHTGCGMQAIVSEIPGTTRDYLEAKLTFDGLSFVLVDTAGLETFDNAVDETSGSFGQDDLPRRLAQSATQSVIDSAALVLFCFDSGESPSETEQCFFRGLQKNVIAVQTKSDRSNDGKQDDRQFAFPFQNGGEKEKTLPVVTSAKNMTGLAGLLERIKQYLVRENDYGEVVPATAVRCRESLDGAAGSIQNALLVLETSGDDLLAAAEIRVALEHIGQMVGAVHSDEILDNIFSRFCIGK
ncbi:MAG: 50S ribosome-binding GTPase [Planctomycetaceae bacterium]|nr:50S ribosome-binding GTPase [Planctomycetaceae bacterium]